MELIKFAILKEGDRLLTAVMQLGEYVLNNRDTGTGYFQNLIENPNENGKYNHILKISFESKGGDVAYRGIEYEEFSLERVDRYAYKKGSPRGGDITPTSKLTGPSKTLNKILISLNDIIPVSDKYPEELTLFKEIRETISLHKNQIADDISNKIEDTQLKKGETFIITLTIYDNGTQKYMGDFGMVKNRLLANKDEQYYIKYGGKVSKGRGVCYYCKKQKEVMGFVNTYNFYTVDKKGFVSGGFRQENAWKNYPVCLACADKLEMGKRYIKENLTSRFSGFDYSVLPKSVLRDDYAEKEFIETLKEFERCAKFSTSETTKQNLLASEKDFTEIMKESKNYLNYNMLIFSEEQSGSVFKVLLYIEDVVPSKVKNILRIKDKVDEIHLFKGLPGKGRTTYDMQFGFDKIRTFFPRNRLEGNFDKNFLEILNNVFTYKKISYKFLLGRMVAKIRKTASQGGYLEALVLQALMNIIFIEELGLFNDKKRGVKKVMIEKTKGNGIYLEFFEDESYGKIFDSDYKCAVFLVGVLTENLLNLQYVEREGRPFYSRLNGLKLDRGLVRRIYTEAINKFNEYGKNYYKELQYLIGMYMLGEKDQRDISNDEVSFYFALGMSLAKHFKKDKNSGEEEGK